MSVPRQAKSGRAIAHMPFSFPGLDRILHGFSGAAAVGGVSLDAEMRRITRGIWGG